MAFTKEQIEQIVKKYGRTAEDTGSSEVQIAILTGKIKELTEHLKQNHKDFSSRQGLLEMVAQRRKLMQYLQRHDEAKYKEIVNELGL